MAFLTFHWGLDVILTFVSLIVTAYLFMNHKLKYWQKRGVQAIPTHPFFGNYKDCFLQRKSPACFAKEIHDLGKGLPYVGFYVFQKPCLLVRDPELIKHILVKDFDVFPDRYATADVNDRLGYANLFMIKNPAWKALRTKITPIFTSGRLKKMFGLMLDIAADLDTHLKSLELDGNGKDVELKDLCANFTTDMIGSTAYGLRANSLNNPDADFRVAGRKVFDLSIWRGFEFTSIFFLPRVVSLLGLKLFGSESSEFIRSAFWSAINHRIESGTKRNDLIDLLIDLKNKHENDDDLEGFKFSGDDLVAQAAIFFTAGFETSSTTMSFTLYELALHPEMQQRLRKEVHDALDETGGKITYDMVTSLPYLDMVVSETLRKYAPLAFLDRVSVADYKVPNTDLVLEKNTPIYISMAGLHYDPEYFPDPEKYDPERFTEENKRNRRHYTYFPFGEGPHNCIGMRMGLLQSKLGIAQVLKDYELFPCERTQIPIVRDPRGLTTTSIGGLYLKLRKITTEAG